MPHIFTRFFRDTSGAITVDWVVLTAAIVGMGIAVLAAVSGGINDAATDINGELDGSNTATVASAITGVAAATGFVPANQTIFDSGYTYVATNTTDKALAYSIAWNNYQANPTSDNLDFLAGSQTALEETGFVVGSPYTRVEDLPAP